MHGLTTSYDNCSLIDCISLLQSMLNSPHAYNQNKAFTKHFIDAMMQSFEEKLELEVATTRKLYDEWEPTINIKIKDYECHTLCLCFVSKVPGICIPLYNNTFSSLANKIIIVG